MGSVNKTPNLELSQFGDNDKPTWRGDYSSDMAKIDSAFDDLNSFDTQTSLALLNLNAAVGDMSTAIDEKATTEYVNNGLTALETSSDTKYQPKADMTPYAKTADVAPLSHDHVSDDVTDLTATVSGIVDAAIAALPPSSGGTATWLSGTYAKRPAVGTVDANTVYVCTDIPEQYIKAGSSWLVFGSGGNSLGSAKSIATATSATLGTFFDVPGMVVNFTAGERPVDVSFACDISNVVASGVSIVRIQVDNNTVLQRPAAATNINSVDSSNPFYAVVPIEDLIPGTSHTVKVSITGANNSNGSSAGGHAYIPATATNPTVLSVVTR